MHPPTHHPILSILFGDFCSLYLYLLHVMDFQFICQNSNKVVVVVVVAGAVVVVSLSSPANGKSYIMRAQR